MPRRPLTVGVVGLGYGRAHIPGFQANGCEVVAVCQRAEAAARSVAERYGVPGVFTRWEEMLEKARPDIVVIATPPSLHLPIATAAFAGGAHVLCEKPLAMSAAEGRDMVREANHSGRIGMTGFNWRFPAAMQRFHAMAEAGHLGRLFHVGARWLGARWADETAPVTWRMDRASAGHGAMGDMGVHVIDMVRWSFGEFVRVAASGGRAHDWQGVPGGKPADTEDFCSMLGVLASGAQVTVQVSRAARGRGEHSIEAYGSAGALEYRLDRSAPRWYRGELRAAGTSGGLAPVATPAGLPRSAGEGDPSDVIGKTTIAPLVKRFLAAIRKGEPASPTLEDGLRAQAVLDAVLEAETGGGWVDVKDPMAA